MPQLVYITDLVVFQSVMSRLSTMFQRTTIGRRASFQDRSCLAAITCLPVTIAPSVFVRTTVRPGQSVMSGGCRGGMR